jgi:hypothetical protein
MPRKRKATIADDNVIQAADIEQAKALLLPVVYVLVRRASTPLRPTRLYQTLRIGLRLHIAE